MSDVDILVLAHNNLQATTQCLAHVLKHTNKCKFYFHDNGSQDETWKFLQSQTHPDLTVTRSERNNGVIIGRNKLFVGIDSHSPYTCFLDNDQYVQDGWLEQHLGYLQERNVDMVGVEAWRMSISPRNRFMPVRRCQSPSDLYHYVGAGGMLIKTEVFIAMRMFDPHFSPAYFEDPDLCFGLHENGYEFAWNPEARIEHEAHSTMKGLSWKTMFQHSHQVFTKKRENHIMRDMYEPVRRGE